MTAAEPTGDPNGREPISYEELALAARNHGMPLEGLRYDITPVGMHYLLIHFDIPAADAETWSIDVGGLVERPFTLSVADLRSRPAVTMPVTLECAGNGRARLNPRPLSQPWLDEAVGTGAWTGTPLGPILEAAGLSPTATEIVFRGADHGMQGDVAPAARLTNRIDACRAVFLEEKQAVSQAKGRTARPGLLGEAENIAIEPPVFAETSDAHGDA